MINACKARNKIYPIVSRASKYALKSAICCSFGAFLAILTLCFGLNPMIFAMPIYSV